MRYTILFLALLSWNSCLAQYGSAYTETTSAKKSLRFAQQFINQEQFELARKQLEHTIKIKDDFAIAYRELGRVYFELELFEAAIEAFSQSFELDHKLSRAAFFECGEANFKLGRIKEAQTFYAKYRDYKGSNYANKQKESGLEITYDLLLSERDANCAYITNLDTSGIYQHPINLGSAINSEQDEYLPTITSDGQQIVFTRQKRKGNEDIMTSERQGEHWKKSHSFGQAINTSNNEGMAKFETHGKAFYFAGCMRADTEGGCDIYKAVMEKEKVGSIKRVEGHLNSAFWDSQPSITCDGQTMYFSSSREGGQGGADIWVSYLGENGTWGHPQNLGPIVNTPGDEEAPFISSDGRTLYFSSNGHPGQGDGDLYIAQQVGGNWSTPENLGYPINSPAKELGIYVQGNGKTAYFASARPGGQGGLDIYQVELTEKVRPTPMVHLEGYVTDATSGEPISASIRISREKDRWTVQSDENGWFFLCVPGDRAYSFQVDEKGYQYLIKAEFLAAQDNARPVSVALELLPIARPKLVAKEVKVAEKRVQFFFEFDSYQLNDNAMQELVKLSDFLLKDDQWKVEVVGYADSKGDVDYNKILSQKRAGAIVDYLKNKGIKIENVIRNEGRGSIQSGTEDDTKFRRVDVILRRS